MAGSASLQDVLGWVNLCGIIEKVKTGIPDVLPEEFFDKKNITGTIGNTGRYTVLAGTRRVARRIEYNAPAYQTELKEVGVKDVVLAHSRESIVLDPVVLQNIRSYDSYENNKGKQEVARQVLQFRKRFDNLRLASVYSLLSKGAIYFDSNGEFLPTSAGAFWTIDFGVPTTNKNQLNGIIASTWSNAGTDITSHLRNLRIQALKDTGYRLNYAFYGKNIPSYFANNTAIQQYLARNPNMRDEYLDTGEIPNGLFGFTWVPVYESFFEDSTSTDQEFFGADQITFTPEVDSDVYELIEGTYPVPTTFEPSESAMGVLSSMKHVQGMFSYAIPIMDPITCRMYFGDTFLPVWKVPNSLYLATVAF